MKFINKLILGSTLFLGACSPEYMKYTPDYVLKYSNPEAYEQRMTDKSCRAYLKDRVILVDGVNAGYDYDVSCETVGREISSPYKTQRRYAPRRGYRY